MKTALKFIVLLFLLNACTADRNDLIDAINKHNNPPVDTDIDSDGDGVLDSQEDTDSTDSNNSCSFKVASQTVATSSTWNDEDCDSDGVNNATEITDATNPINADTDDDGVNDGIEKEDGTDPSKKDTDGDGVNDGVEKTDKTDPLKRDTDSDGVNDGTEKADDTDPLNADSDEDGVKDGAEKTDGTNPMEADSDGDTLNDGTEKQDGTNPLKIDTDGDGVTDGQEKTDTTNALDRCSFVLNNQQEVPNTAWNSADCDNDGITNATEVTNGTDPLVFDAPTPVASPIAGVWNLTKGVINDGTGTTVYIGQTYDLTYTATSSNENVQVEFSENPDKVTSTGNYTMLLNFKFLGSDYQDTMTSESPFSNGDWSINGNTLTIDANTTVNGSYDIIDLTETTLILSTPVNREVPAGGLNLTVQGTLILTFTK